MGIIRGGELSTILKAVAKWTGVAILLVSMWLSFDGFDGAVNGGSGTSTLGKVIGLIFALAVTVMQFIFTSDYRELNSTLKVVGVLSYVYSIYTNMLGAISLLNMSQEMAWITAIFADVVAEPMIAWGMGESAVGDLLGNLKKSLEGKNTSVSRPMDENTRSKLPKKPYKPQTFNIPPKISGKTSNNNNQRNFFDN